MRWVTQFGETGWRAGFPEPEDPATIQWAANGCGDQCTASGDSTNVTIGFVATPSIGAPTYDVSAELLDATDPAHPKVLATLPVDSTIPLPRSPG
jgi:hypothetical protein